MYGNKVFLSTYDARVIALNRDTGEVAWEVQAAAPMDPKTGTPSKTQAFSGAPLAIKIRGRQGPRDPGRKHRRLAGHAKLDRRLRRQYRQARVAHLHDSRRRASPAPRPGRTTTMPGASAAPACGRPPPTIRPPTSSISAPATPSRPSIPNSARATISSPPARSRSMPIPARSCGTSRRRRTSIGTSTRRARRCSTRSTINGETAQGRRQLLAQRLLLHARSRQRPVPARRPVPGEGDLDQGHRPQDRQARRLRPEPRRAALCRASASGAASPDRKPARGTAARRRSSRRPSMPSA